MTANEPQEHNQTSVIAKPTKKQATKQPKTPKEWKDVYHQRNKAKMQLRRKTNVEYTAAEKEQNAECNRQSRAVNIASYSEEKKKNKQRIGSYREKPDGSFCSAEKEKDSAKKREHRAENIALYSAEEKNKERIGSYRENLNGNFHSAEKEKDSAKKRECRAENVALYNAKVKNKERIAHYRENPDFQKREKLLTCEASLSKQKV